VGKALQQSLGSRWPDCTASLDLCPCVPANAQGARHTFFRLFAQHVVDCRHDITIERDKGLSDFTSHCLARRLQNAVASSITCGTVHELSGI
jgi:hypothetical protein